MPDTRTDWTAGMLAQLPDDGNRYEVIDGELFVSPAPSLTHQRAVFFLRDRIAPYAEAVDIEVLGAPIGIRFSPTTELQPDLCAWCLVPGKVPMSYSDMDGLVLAVEVLSRSTAHLDRQRKRRLYQRENVAEYWIVDPANRLVERYRPEDEDAEVLLTELVWQPVQEREPLRIDLAEYFGAVYREHATPS